MQVSWVLQIIRALYFCRNYSAEMSGLGLRQGHEIPSALIPEVEQMLVVRLPLPQIAELAGFTVAQETGSGAHGPTRPS